MIEKVINMNNNIELHENEVLCPKCGAICNEQHMFCAVCGSPMKEQTNVTSDVSAVNSGTVYVTSTPEQTSIANQATVDKGYVPWVWAAYLGLPCGYLLNMVVGGMFFLLGGFVSLFSVIYAKVKYPNVTAVKVAFWIIMLLYVASILIIVAVIALFFIACSSCANEMSEFML